ncbi:MAG: hypothetical protein AAGF07_02060 [Patescibacteria group bacterium]
MYTNSNSFLEGKFVAAEDETANDTKYHVSLISYSLVAIFCYYLGAFLIVFLRNDLNGAIVSAAPDYDISWKIAFENFPQLLKNVYDSFFGYFFAYSQLYNRSTAFLIPVDIGIKLITICYFLFFWIPWDTNRAFKLGYFNEDYPYVSDDYKDEVAESKNRHTKIKKVSNSLDSEPSFGDNMQEESKKPLSLYPEYNLNPYLRAQKLKSLPHKQQSADMLMLSQTESNLLEADLEEDEDEEDSGILPFSGVHKPLEELYQRYEKAIYDLIRKRVLPGSNILIVGYFSTLFIVDLANPITVVLYILGTMSMFWCMQSFLLVIDYLQFPPE